MISRRSLFGGAAALVAAPAIVRLASIMPVSVAKRRPCYSCGALYGHSPSCAVLVWAERLVNPPMAALLQQQAFRALVWDRLNVTLFWDVPFVDASAAPVEFSFASTTSS